ncbi:MAG: PEFG-CTERM sorting domain-containing protein [Candidatus Nitrosopumilus sp. bin_7KS]
MTLKYGFVVLTTSMVFMLGFGTLTFAEISLSSYDSTIGPTDRLLIMGTIDVGDIQLFHPIKLVVYDPSGKIVYQPNVTIDAEGKFKYMITPTPPSFAEGKYTVEASHEDLEDKTQIHFTVSSDVLNENMEEETVPEYGIIMALILIVAIIIIAIFAKSKSNNASDVKV